MFIIIDTHTCTDILWSKSDTIFCSLFTAIRMSMTNQRNVKITHYFSVLVNITNSPVPKFHKEKKLGRYFKRFLSLHICNWRNLWKFDEWQMWWWQVEASWVTGTKEIMLMYRETLFMQIPEFPYFYRKYDGFYSYCHCS